MRRVQLDHVEPDPIRPDRAIDKGLLDLRQAFFVQCLRDRPVIIERYGGGGNRLPCTVSLGARPAAVKRRM